jgi:hypothetical protein
MNFIYGPGVVNYVVNKIDFAVRGTDAFGMGVMKDNKLALGVVFHEYQPTFKDICASITITDKSVLSRAVLKKLFEYPFKQLKLDRITCHIDEFNNPSRSLCTRLGFVFEGRLRQGSINENDLMIFGMLRDECRWL